MKEHMADYIDAHYIFLEQNYGSWDPHLCHWGISDIILDACVYGPYGDLLTWRYKHFHDFLMRYLLDVLFYYVFMYFDDIYYILMIFGKMHTRKWDPRIMFPNGMGWRALLIVGVQYNKNLEIVLKLCKNSLCMLRCINVNLG